MWLNWQQTSRGLSVLTLCGALSAPAYAYQFKAPPPNTNVTPELQFLQQFSKGIANISERTRRALVFVSISKTVTMPGGVNPFDFFFGPNNPFNAPGNGGGGGGGRQMEQKQRGLGSGFLIDLDKGYVITNNHVVADADEITLKLPNDSTYDAKVLGRDANTDVAVVQIKDPKFKREGLEPLYLADSDAVKIGEIVLAAGAPFGLEASYSLGIISATNRQNLNITTLGNFIQTDAAVNPGNSGGPLLDVNGNVIGMNTAIFSRSGASAGIGFAVPANLVREVASQLITRGKVSRGYLGVNLVQNIDDDVAQGLGLPAGTQGALVASVRPGTPASKGGLESGDVVVAVNNHPVEDNQALTNRIGLLPPGTKVEMTVLRNGKKRNVNIVLAQYPEEERLAAGSAESGRGDEATAGMKLTPLSGKGGAELSALRKKYGFKADQGLLVTAVDENSMAFAVGLKPGDVILSANKRSVNRIADFKEAFDKASDRVVLRIEREGSLVFIAMRK